MRNQAEFLEHDADAGRDRIVIVREMAGGAVDFDRAGIRLMNAAQDLHQRRLARAVLAEQRVDLAARNLQINVGQRLHARKAFVMWLSLSIASIGFSVRRAPAVPPPFASHRTSFTS